MGSAELGSGNRLLARLEPSNIRDCAHAPPSRRRPVHPSNRIAPVCADAVSWHGRPRALPAADFRTTHQRRNDLCSPAPMCLDLALHIATFEHNPILPRTVTSSLRNTPYALTNPSIWLSISTLACPAAPPLDKSFHDLGPRPPTAVVQSSPGTPVSSRHLPSAQTECT